MCNERSDRLRLQAKTDALKCAERIASHRNRDRKMCVFSVVVVHVVIITIIIVCMFYFCNDELEAFGCGLGARAPPCQPLKCICTIAEQKQIEHYFYVSFSLSVSLQENVHRRFELADKSR